MAHRRATVSRPRRHLVPLVLTGLGAISLALVLAPGASSARGVHRSASAHGKTLYYISLGDSYSVGYQPSPTPGSTNGFTVPVAKKEKLILENFGCGGATTSSILDYTGDCVTDPPSGEYGPPAATDPGPHTAKNSQVQDAEAFISAHKGSIGLITVSISGNDVTACAQAADPITCVEGVTSEIQTNVTKLASDLATAAGSGVPIIGLTYPDVILGEWVCDSTTGKPPCLAGSPNQTLANESIEAFQTLINPTLLKAYTSVSSGAFVDVTTATGAYTPLTQLTKNKTYGEIPVAVNEICELTWYCQLANIHANTKGYNLIAGLIETEYAKLPHP